MERKNAPDVLTRARCTQAASPLQLAICEDQKPKPESSASRPRKSLDCCSTKKVVASMSFESSVTVPAVLKTPLTIVCPCTFETTTVDVFVTLGKIGRAWCRERV